MSSVAGSELGGRHDAAVGLAEGLINLGAAAKLVPGRVSTHCLWRWCRRGIQARSGERVHLEHVRLGGRVYTRADWIIAFGKRLAETDAAHYDARGAMGSQSTLSAKGVGQAGIAGVEAELREARL